STSTIRNTMSSLPLKDCFSWLMDGISWIHGGHHVAQKLMNTTLPFKDGNDIIFPLSSLKEIPEASGASTAVTSSVAVLLLSTLFCLFLSVFPQAANVMTVIMKRPERIAKFLNCMFMICSQLVAIY